QRQNLVAIDGLRQQLAVVDARVPRRVAARTRLELGTQGEAEREVDQLVPQELVLLTCHKVIRGRLGRVRREPAGQVGDRRRQGDARAPRGRGLGARQEGL